MATVHSSKALLALRGQRAIKGIRVILVQRVIKVILGHREKPAQLARKGLKATKASKACKDHKANVAHKVPLVLKEIPAITLS